MGVASIRQPTVTERRFDVSAETLFSVLTEPTTYPEWLVGTKRILTVSADWPAEGSDFRHVVGFGPVAISDRTSVRAIDRPRSFVLFVRARPVIKALVSFDVTAHGAASTLTMSEAPTGWYALVAPFARPLIKARNSRSLERLAGVLAASEREQGVGAAATEPRTAPAGAPSRAANGRATSTPA